MKKIAILLLLVLSSLSLPTMAKTILKIDPITHRPVLMDDADVADQKVPFLTDQAPQATQLSQAPTPPPELAQMPQISFSQATGGASQLCFAQPSCPVGQELRGCLRIDDFDEKIPEFRLCFKGKEVISNSEGFYSIPLGDEKPEYLSLVICRAFKQHFDKANTIKNVELIPDKDYKFYTIKKNGCGTTWVHQEATIDNKKFIIPENSLIVLIPPKYVDRVEPWNLKLASNSIPLPTIVLKKDFLGKQLERTSAKSLLYSLDKTAFHEPIKRVCKVDQSNPKVCLSLAQ